MMKKPAGPDLFLDRVCEEVKAREMHDDIRKELGSHLEELIMSREDQGNTREEAELWAVAQMGDPKSLGKKLHHVHKPRMNWGMLGAVLIFTVVSLLGMGSVESSAVGDMQGITFLRNQTIFVGIGLLLMIGMYYFDFRKLQKLSWPLYFLT